MFRTGKECEEPGVYRSTDCGYEVTLIGQERFPDCPLHDRPVTWTFVRKVAAPAHKTRKRRTRKG
jgi:hypothetical protein